MTMTRSFRVTKNFRGLIERSATVQTRLTTTGYHKSKDRRTQNFKKIFFFFFRVLCDDFKFPETTESGRVAIIRRKTE